MSEVYAHFIGVGGAGMSAIARVLNERGLRVTGSDMKESRYTRRLKAEGVEITIGHDARNVGDPTVVVVSSAVGETNVELAEARRRGLEVWPRARMLAEVARGRATVAVAGTHGKTSTSAMCAAMLVGMGEDPTFLVGGEVAGFGVNARSGEGALCVVEADESDGSFMYLDPRIAVVTNVEAEHLDHYGTLEAVERQFAEFMRSVPPDGTLVLCADEPRLLDIASGCAAHVVTYGRVEGADVRYERTATAGTRQSVQVTFPDGRFVHTSIPLPGDHMASNATAALALAYALGLDVESAAASLGDFAGVKRRFDRVGEQGGVTVVDDYAHHPTEVRATIKAARESGCRRLWVLFQPHRYTRTQALRAEFGSAFEGADRLVLMDVYSAGETPVPGITGKTLLEAVLDHDPRTRVAYLPHRGDVGPFIAAGVRPGDLVMTMGAGDVTTMGAEILRSLSGHEANTCR